MCAMTQNRLHTRKAAAALLKMAQATTDLNVTARLVEAAAELKEQPGELPPPTSPKAPTSKPSGKTSARSRAQSASLIFGLPLERSDLLNVDSAPPVIPQVA